MASARVLERLELDSVISVPLLDRSFLYGKTEFEGLDPDGEDEEEELDEFSARVGMVALRGSFSVASSNKLVNTISLDIQEHEVVIFDFTDTVSVDDSAALVVEQLIDVAMDEDTECIVMGLAGRPATTLLALNVLRRVPEDHIVETLDDARKIAKQLLGV